LGRGTRNCPGKTDCLVADHGKNLAYHGPIDRIRPKEPGSGLGDQPKKRCPDGTLTEDKVDIEGKCGCGEMIAISIMTCQCCGYIFPPNEEEKITAQAADAPVLSTEKPWFTVDSRDFKYKPPKEEGNPPSVWCTYTIGKKTVNEFLCPQHMEHPVEKSRAFPKGKADRWWHARSGKRPFPKTVIEFLERQHELLPETEVQLDYSKDHKYPSIVGFRLGERPANDNHEPAANDNVAWRHDLAGSIPF
jgi:DNA repair protein RadD